MKHSQTSNQAKKPFYKKWWFWAIVVVIAINAIGSTNATDGPDNAVTEVATATESVPQVDPEFDKLHFETRKVNNDKTGRWRISVISDSINVADYAKDYYDKYFESDDEIHWIVNFTYQTTTVIRSYGVMLDVVITEYVPREEHDAVMLGTGMQLGHIQVDTATGEVTKLETFDPIAEMEKTQQIAESLAAQFQDVATAE